MVMFHMKDRNNSTMSCDEQYKDEHLGSFEPVEVKTTTLRKEYGLDDDKEFTEYHYDLKELTKRTKHLMHMLNIPFDLTDESGELDENFIPFDKMSEQDIEFWYPFGYILACLDGNAFDHTDPQYDLVSQYASSARYCVYRNNMSIKEEHKDNINKLSFEERKNAFFFDEQKVKERLVVYLKRAVTAFEGEGNDK